MNQAQKWMGGPQEKKKTGLGLKLARKQDYDLLQKVTDEQKNSDLIDSKNKFGMNSMNIMGGLNSLDSMYGKM